MATLISLADAGALIKLDQRLRAREQAQRLLFLRQEAIDDIRARIVGQPADRGTELNPLEQLNARFIQFVAGHRMVHPKQFHVLDHVDAGVWELKTVDVRLFGWFARRDTFVATNADMKRNIVSKRLYEHYRDQAVAFRNGLDLDEPKYVSGDDPSAVVSA